MSYPSGWPAPGKMHFRLQEPHLGSIDLDCDGGYVVTSYDLGFPVIREVAMNNSLDDGTYDLTQYIGNRAITLEITLKTHKGINQSSQHIAAESVLRDRLLRFCHPRARPVLVFSEHGDDRVKQAMMRASQGSIAVGQKYYNKLSLSWVAPRGAFVSWDQRCYTTIFDSTTPDTQTVQIFNAGSAPATWTAHLSGEAVKPRFILNGHTILEMDFDSKHGDVIHIDSFSRSVQINGNQAGYTYVNDNSEWWMVPPGYSTLTVEQDGASLEGYPLAFWQPGGTGREPTNWAIPPGTTPPNNPSPAGAPPWSWTTEVDPNTGLPGFAQVDFCFYDTFV
jgi:Siphovirus-type tail component, C-terminal domain